ncbi:MAG TPA: molybdopterin converting factor subunit 1 [Anaerolineales bacterium]
MNKVKVLFFATLRQRAGMKSLELEIPEDMDVQGLRAQLSRDYPALRESLKTVVVSINREFAFDEAVIPANGEIALFPPVSGG